MFKNFQKKSSVIFFFIEQTVKRVELYKIINIKDFFSLKFEVRNSYKLL